MSDLRVTVLSSVPKNIFQTHPDSATSTQIASALRSEEEVFRTALGMTSSRVEFEVIRVLEGIPKTHTSDLYVLGGSPAMVTDMERHPWMQDYRYMIRDIVDRGTPMVGMCFGHQMIHHALGGQVASMPKRRFGPLPVVINGATHTGYYSHSQSVVKPAPDAEILASLNQSNGIISVDTAQIGDDIWTTQSHPEFDTHF